MRDRNPFLLVWTAFVASLAFTGCADRTLAPEDGPQGSTPPQVQVGGNYHEGGVVEGPPAPYVSSHLVAEVADGWTVEEINDRWGMQTVALLEGTSFALLRTPWPYDYDATARELLQSGACVSCGRDYIVQSPEAEQGSISFYEGDLVSEDMADQGAFDRVRIEQAHTAATGAGIVIAIIDTGVDFTHPELAPILSSNGYDFLDDDADPSEEIDDLDDDEDGVADEAAGHGTHVAGIAHAVAPNATILPVRVLDNEGAGTVFGVAQGVLYAVEQGARVINLSLGFEGHSRVVEYVAAQANAAGVFLVASAGNQGVATSVHFPASLPTVTAVAATDDADLKAPFSNYGGYISVSAPGVGIISTYLFQGYAVWSGTSMAAPFIAGAGALVLDAGLADDPADVRSAIEHSSAKLSHVGHPYEGLMGAGRLDARLLVALSYYAEH
jgi:subtilisin family serine protease